MKTKQRKKNHENWNFEKKKKKIKKKKPKYGWFIASFAVNLVAWSYFKSPSIKLIASEEQKTSFSDVINLDHSFFGYFPKMPSKCESSSISYLSRYPYKSSVPRTFWISLRRKIKMKCQNEKKEKLKLLLQFSQVDHNCHDHGKMVLFWKSKSSKK